MADVSARRSDSTPSLFDDAPPRPKTSAGVDVNAAAPLKARVAKSPQPARHKGLADADASRAKARSSAAKVVQKSGKTRAAPYDKKSKPAANIPESPVEAPEAAISADGPSASTAAAARPARRATAESMAGKQRDISVSEFFAKNRHLLGFDNKRKALLTTVKEAVDNSLDACEEAGILPDIWVTIDQLAEDRFRVAIRDSGPGIVKGQIPNIFGKLLYGSKFHRLKMSRGQQGIGISAAGMYGMLTTGKSIKIISRTGGNKDAHHFELQIDTAKNRPEVILDETAQVEWPHGTEVTIELAASYMRGKQSVDEYLEQTAIANPHAQISYKAPTGERREFPRSSPELPPEPKEIKPHPHGIELGVLIKMLKDAASVPRGQRRPSLSGFFQNEFSRVSGKVAHDICEAAGIDAGTLAGNLDPHDPEKLYNAIQKTKIMAPPTDCLAPIGPKAILAGLLKEVKPEFVTAVTRDPAVYRGNPFAIEAGLAFGGSIGGEAGRGSANEGASDGGGVDGSETAGANQPARVIRFANRVPLLYQQSACCIFKAVTGLEWRRYGLSQPSGSLPMGPLVIMVHMASVWVPFTSESKEAIADYDEIAKEIRLALFECGRKLQAYLNKRKRQRYEGERRNVFERYIAEVVSAVNTIKPVNAEDLKKRLSEIAKMRTAKADQELDDEGRAMKEEEADGDENTVIVERGEAAPAGLF